MILAVQMVAERQRPDLGAMGARKGFGGAAPEGGGKARGSSNPFDEAEAEAGPPPPSYEDTFQETTAGKADSSSYFLAEVSVFSSAWLHHPCNCWPGIASSPSLVAASTCSCLVSALSLSFCD